MLQSPDEEYGYRGSARVEWLKVIAPFVGGLIYCWAGSALINAVFPVGGASW